MKAPIITFTDFTFKYDSQKEPTLKNINVTIYEGEKILVVGASGSGKSTFAHCINGLIPFSYEGESSGTVFVCGKEVNELNLAKLSYDVGTVLQDTDGQFVGLTVGEDIAFALENDSVPKSVMHQKVTSWAEMVELADFLQHRPNDLSGGQKQRVSMAGVLVNETPILLFDEPLANLDPSAGLAAMELIDRLQKKSGATVVIIEHRLEEVLTQSVDRVLVFADGQITSDFAPEKLLCSTVLFSHGIREPLYVTALKYAGVDLSFVSGISSLATISGKDIEKKLSLWVEGVNSLEIPIKHELLLRLTNITAYYPQAKTPVLKNVSLDFLKGEMVSIVGKNGAGKSSLVKAICGFLPVAMGDIFWKDEDFLGLSIKERSAKVGYVMQNPNQMISERMIFDEVALGLVLRGVCLDEIRERVYKTLKICGLYHFRNWPISALSFGQKKRVTIAAILVLEPEMLILDEPTAGQDFKHYTEMMVFLEELNRLGKTIVLVTHDMHLMLEYTDRAIVLGGGQVLADAPPAEVLTNSDLVRAASLKETSLFTLAKKFSLSDPNEFVKEFISYDRKVRRH